MYSSGIQELFHHGKRMFMRTSSFFTVSLLTLATVQAIAAISTEIPPSWMTAHLTIPSQDQTPLRITLEPDMRVCRAQYGKAAYRTCDRTIGSNSQIPQGIRIEPAIPGTWRWEGVNYLVFRPENPWPEKQTFTVDLRGLSLPTATTLQTPTIAFQTPPRTLLDGRIHFWMDSSMTGDRAMSVEATFSAPVTDTTTFEKAIQILGAENAGIQWGKIQYIWNATRTRLYMRVPIVRLGKTAQIAVVFPDTIGQWKANDKNIPVVVPGFEKAQLRHTIPAAQDLYRIQDAQMHFTRTARLDPIFEVTIRPTIRTKPADLMRSLVARILPARLHDNAVSPTDWRQIPTLSNETLEKAQVLSVQALQPADIPTDRITLQFTVPANQFVYFALPQGFGPDSNATLQQGWQAIFLAQEQQPTVAFLQPGSMMTLSGTRTLTIFSDGIERIQWRIERIRDPYLALSAQNYNAHRYINHDDTLVQAQRGIIRNKGQRFTALHLDNANLPRGKAGLFQITLQGQKQENGHWVTVSETQKRVLVTDTALLAKTRANGRHQVFVANLMTGKPSPGLKAQLLGANGLALETVYTDNRGIAHFATTQGLTREKAPSAIIVTNEKTGDLAWLSLADHSNIDFMETRLVTGRQVSQDGLTGFVFTDRGIYRPGETIHIASIVKKANWEALPTGLPFRIQVTDSMGKRLAVAPLTMSSEGTSSWQWTIPENTLPGTLKIDLLAGQEVLSSYFSTVGDFRAESMRLTAELENRAAGWRLPDDLSVLSTLRMQYGQVAAQKNVRAQVYLSAPQNLSFAKFKGWTFVNPTPYEGPIETVRMTSQQTDAQGKTHFTLPLKHLQGTLQARLLLEGFEVAGVRAATENLSFLVAPTETMLGWRTIGSEKDFTWTRQNEKRRIEFVLVDRFLQPQANETLQVHILSRQPVTELSTDSQGRLRYDEKAIETLQTQKTLTLDANGKTRLTLPTDSTGDFTLQVTNHKGQVLAHMPYHVAGYDLRPALRGQLSTASAKLHIAQKDYQTGQRVTLDLTSPYDGLALITLEADQILRSQWVPVKAGANTVHLPLTTPYSGRAWVCASILRSHTQSQTFLKAYTRSARPVTINRKPHVLDVRIRAAERVSNARNIPVLVKASEKSRVFVWAVDTGILSLTRYTTPSPVRALLEDRALQVKTRQTLDGLMPEGILLPGQSPFGGGFEAAKAMRAGLANPFRRTIRHPAVWWAGRIETDPRGRTVMMNLPEEFNGTVKIFATGASADMVGSYAHDLTIQAPQILTPIFPTFVAPNDQFQASIFLRSDSPWQGSISLRVPGGFTASETQKEVHVAAHNEYASIFNFTATEKVGNQSLKVHAQSSQVNSTPLERTTTLSVRPAALRSQEVYWQPLGQTKEVQLQLQTPLLSYDNETYLTVSSSPFVLAHAIMQGMPQATWFCADEYLSSALPWVMLLQAREEKLPHRDRERFEKEAHRRIQAAIDYLDRHWSWQGIARWPWEAPDVYTTTVALDFLLSLREQGWRVRPQLLTKIKDSLTRTVSSIDPQNIAQARTAAWAYAQLTREGSIQAEAIESLRTLLDERKIAWKNDVTALYFAYAYQWMRMHDEAQALLRTQQKITFESSHFDSIDGLTGLALAVRLMPQKAWLDSLIQGLKVRPIRTLSQRERAMLAAAFLIRQPTEDQKAQLATIRLSCLDPMHLANQSQRTQDALTRTLVAPQCQRFSISSDRSMEGLYVTAQASGWPKLGHTQALANGISIQKRFLNRSGAPVQTVQAGDIITVEIRVRRTTSQSDGPVVITDLFPGGFTPFDHREELQGQYVRQTSILEDRLVGITQINAHEQVYTYRLRAQIPGVYTVPAIEASDSLQPTLRGHDTATTITVLP